MCSLKCVVGQLSVMDGVRYTQAENVLAVEPGSFPHSTRNHYGLYAVLELSGLVPPPPELLEQLLNVLQDEFYGSSGSVALSLQNAIAQVNQSLYDFNLDQERNERQGGGLTCIALRGTDLYLAQGGPTVAYHVAQGRTCRFPDRSPWLDEDFDEDGTPAPRPLGATRQFTPEITHRQVSAGDFVVLAESLLGQTVSLDQVEQAVFPGDVRLTVERLADLLEDEDNFSVAVVEVRGATISTRIDQLQSEAEQTARVVSSAKQLPVASEVPRRTATKRKHTVGHRTAGLRRDAGRDAEQSLWTRIDWARVQASLSKILSRVGAWIVAGLGVTWVLLKTLVIRILPGGHDTESTRPEGGRKPTPPAKPHAAQSGRSRAGQRRLKSALASIIAFNLWKYVAIAIPILVLVIVGLVYMQRERAVHQAHDQLIQSARAKYDQALAKMADADLARTLLSDALRKLDEANTILPIATEPPNLRKDILKNIDQLNQVKRLYFIPQLHQYTAMGTNLGRIVVDGINVYVLDRGTNRVFKHVLNETEDGFVNPGDEPVLMEKGKQVDDVVVGELLDMNWAPAGGGRQTGNLVIVDKMGNLFDYGATYDLKHRPLAATDEWQYPQVVCGFFGNLYVLDSQRNQILKYLPTPADGGYSNAPQEYIIEGANVDLTGAVDMAIDGHVYVLYANGRILKLMSGASVPFEVIGLDTPLNNPTAIFTNADQDTQYLYVADRGNKRIVQLTKDGRFQKQYKVDTDAFNELRSLWVDELEQKMYIVSGNSVFITNLLLE